MTTKQQRAAGSTLEKHVADQRVAPEALEKTSEKLRKLDAQAATSDAAKEKADALMSELLVKLGLKTDRSWQSAPLASELTPPQRAVVQALMELEFTNWTPLPSSPTLRHRWLGLEPPGALESPVSFTLRGARRTEPLWRALNLLRDQTKLEGGVEDAAETFIAGLPVGLRLAAFEELQFFYEPSNDTDSYGVTHWQRDELWAATEPALQALDASLLPWARAVAERWSTPLPAVASARPSPPRFRLPSDRLGAAVFAILLGASEPIAPAWDRLIPCFGQAPDALVDRALAALPEERRLVQLVRLFGEHFGPGEILARALRHFAALPDPALYKLLKKQFAEYPGAVHKKALAALDALAKAPRGKHAAGKATDSTDTRKLPKGVLAFDDAVTLQTKLTDVQEAQMTTAGAAYFGEKRTLAKLLSQTAAEGESFFGNLTLATLAGADGKPAWDYVYVMADSGLVFAAGTTKVAAQIVQDGIECTDARIAKALAKGLALLSKL